MDELSKREYVALELLKSRDITVAQALQITDELLGNRLSDDADLIFSYSPQMLEMTVRSSNVLRGAGIKTIGHLVTLSSLDVLRFPNAGKKSLTEISDMLAINSLKLDMNNYEILSYKPKDDCMLVVNAEKYPHIRYMQ